MKEQPSCVTQTGLIEHIDGDIARVSVVQTSACASCGAKQLCNPSETKEKHLDVHLEGAQYKVGEKVEVLMQKHLGLQAVILAYIAPFMLILITLIIFTSAGLHEVISGIASLGILVPYYFLLSKQKKILQKKFYFTLRKVQTV